MKQTINNFSTLTSFFYLYSSPPPPLICWLIKTLFLVLHLCGLKKYVIELIYSLLLHICHSLRKYYPRKIHQHNTSAPKYPAHLACKRVKETNEMQKVIYTEVSK